MTKHILSAIIGALVTVVAIIAFIFFWQNPFRQGEIIINTPSGASLKLSIANSNDITELFIRAMDDEESGVMISNSLMSVIERIKPESALGEKLCRLVDERKPPFCVNSVPVKLVFDDKVPSSIAAPCEKSIFLAKSIIVYPVVDENGGGDPMNTLPLYVDSRLARVCPEGSEIMRVNSNKVEEFNRYRVMAKRDF